MVEFVDMMLLRGFVGTWTSLLVDTSPLLVLVGEAVPEVVVSEGL